MNSKRKKIPVGAVGAICFRTAATYLLILCRSIKIAIVVLLLVALVSVAGAVVPQHQNYDKYVQLYGSDAAAALSRTGLTNVFTSWWYLTLVGYLLASMIICSAMRLPRILRIAKLNDVLLEQEQYEKSRHYRCFALDVGAGPAAERIADKIVELLSKTHYQVANIFSRDDVYYLAARKGSAGLFGPFLIHMSLIVIAVGGFCTAAKSYSHFMNIAVGESSPLPGTPYTVHLDDFIVNYYEGTDRPSEYTSVLSVAENNRQLGRGRLTVNKPLTVAGISFYQMKYNPAVSDVTIAIAGEANGDKLGTFQLPLHRKTYIDKIGSTIKPVDFLPDFALTSDGVAVSRTADFRNPAVQLEISTSDGAKTDTWVFYNPSDFHAAAAKGYIYSMESFTRKSISGIKVIRDRAVPIVYVGFVLLVAGAFLSCYVFHRRLWVMVSRRNGQIHLQIAGTSSRNTVDFQRELTKIEASIKSFTSEVTS